MTEVSRREAVLLAIDGYRRRHGYSPSVRDIERLLGMRSTFTAYYYYRQLARFGLISWRPNTARSVTLTPSGEEIVRRLTRYGED